MCAFLFFIRRKNDFTAVFKNLVTNRSENNFMLNHQNNYVEYPSMIMLLHNFAILVIKLNIL